VITEPNFPTPVRKKLPEERQSITHHFHILNDELSIDAYLTCGMYPSGRLGEIFFIHAKAGEFHRGILDAWATGFSIALQYGVPMNALVKKIRGTQFGPHGVVQGAPEAMRNNIDERVIRTNCVLDYIGRYLELAFPNGMASKQTRVRAVLNAKNSA